MSGADTERDAFLKGVFPEGFAWSTATAAYQIEGAWNIDGRGPSIWDTFSHTPGNVKNGDTGDVACDSYHKINDDVELIKALGTKYYRFSISWSRVLTDGTPSSLNEAGVQYYNKLINALLSAGVTPFVTLYHWDLPQALQDRGGWQSPSSSDWFKDYARICYEKFGDRVKNWITFNEQLCVAWLGHGSGEHAPGIKDPVNAAFTVGHNTILGHSKAWRLYDTEFRVKQKGKVGITFNYDWTEPRDRENPDDVEAADKVTQCRLGWFANPVFGNGDYPEIMKAQLSLKAKQLGLPHSPLPQFSEEEKRLNRGTWDFFGLNHYTTRYAQKMVGVIPPETEADFMDVKLEIDPSWSRGASDWLYAVPWGLRRLLNWIKDHYGNPPVYITENGTSDSHGSTKDNERIEYYRTYINEVLKAIRIDDCNILGYTAWSLLDNFEWAKGYTERFGLHLVDFNDPARKRTAKDSAAWYANIVKNNGFP